MVKIGEMGARAYLDRPPHIHDFGPRNFRPYEKETDFQTLLLFGDVTITQKGIPKDRFKLFLSVQTATALE
jgi:hypothetical protein